MSGLFERNEEPVARHHERGNFDCGVPELNEYLDRYARQNHEFGGAKTFVAVSEVKPTQVLGYYSISPGAIEFNRVPTRITKKFGRYEVPVFRVGRLAVSLSMQGQGLGGDLRHRFSDESRRVLDEFSQARRKWLIPRVLGVKRSGVYCQTRLSNVALIAATVLKRL